MVEKASRRDALIGTATGLLAGAMNPIEIARAQQPSVRPAPSLPPTTFAEVTKPANGVIMPEGYVRAMARFAYLWGWPLVNMVNRRALFSQAPEPGLLGGIVPVAPRGRIAMLVDYVSPAETFVTCPNQDVVYGLGFFGLDAEPVVIQVPDFGDRFWVYASTTTVRISSDISASPMGQSQASTCSPGRTGVARFRPESTRSSAARPNSPTPSLASFSTTPPRTAPRFGRSSTRSSPFRFPSSTDR
jgi:Protein of unknown function (DUF1254)